MEAELPFPDAKDGSGSLDAVGIVKRYAIVSVFEGVDCSLRPGRIHTVIGENGAGKSTLFKIMSGLVQPSEGELKLDGQPLTLASPRVAHNDGIYLIPQEPALMAARAVAETKFGEPLPTRGRAKAPRWGFRPRASRLEPEDEIGRRFPYWRGTRQLPADSADAWPEMAAFVWRSSGRNARSSIPCPRRSRVFRNRVSPRPGTAAPFGEMSAATRNWGGQR
jgi:ABC transporter